MKKLLIILTSFLISISGVFAQSTSVMYREANKIFKNYRYKVPYENFQIHTNTRNGKKITELLLIVSSRRNNFDEALLVGFAGAGAAISNTGAKIDRVNVVIKVQYKDEVSIAAIADGQDVVSLYENRLQAGAFMNKVIFY